MSKISSFKQWYEKYLQECDDCYEKSLKNEYVDIEKLTEKLDILMQARLTGSDMNQRSALDDKIKYVNDALKTRYKRIDAVG